MIYQVREFTEVYSKSLQLQLIAGKEGQQRLITKTAIERPGLALSGFTKGLAKGQIMLLDKAEALFLRQLPVETVHEVLPQVFTRSVPMVVVANGHHPRKEMIAFCNAHRLPLFRTPLPGARIHQMLSLALSDAHAPLMTIHATLMEVFGVGIIIQGDAAVGKSETALGLIERGHRLVSDDIVEVFMREGSYLEGSGPKLTRHLMEVRGVGIISVTDLYGTVCVRETKRIEVIVNLELWDERHAYERLGVDRQTIETLGVTIPYHILPLHVGKSAILLIETIALNHRLNSMGHNVPRQFAAEMIDRIRYRSARRSSWLD